VLLARAGCLRRALEGAKGDAAAAEAFRAHMQQVGTPRAAARAAQPPAAQPAELPPPRPPPHAPACLPRCSPAQATELLATYFPGQLDSGLVLPGYWSHVEARLLGDMKAARAVWEAVLKGPLGRCGAGGAGAGGAGGW
jgi:hypothetical protein